jgi:phosphoribosylglycinamide formyltransferase-1
MYDIGWFSTARGPTSRLLLKEACEAMQRGEIKARIAYVFCNRERGEAGDTDLFLDQVQSYGIPLVACSSTRFRDAHDGKGAGFDGKVFSEWRRAYDQEVLTRLEGRHSDLNLLAGYMLVMTEPLCRRVSAINLHPAAPGGPIGTWQQVIWRLIEARAKQSGVYMHVVAPELDLGPVVSYCTYPVAGGHFDALWSSARDVTLADLQKEGEQQPLFRAIREEGVRREVPLILETLGAFSERRVSLEDGRPVDPDGVPISGQDLTLEIESRLVRHTP